MLYLCPLLWAAPLGVADLPNPRSAGSWVSDTAMVIPADVEERINRRVDALQAELGAEVAVVTAHEVDGTPKEVATALLNTWGVGAAKANSGVLVLLVVDARRVEVEVGYGLEAVLTDGVTGRLLDQHVVPAFKQGDYAGGLEAGVAAIDERLRADGESTRVGTGGAVDVPGGGEMTEAASRVLPPSGGISLLTVSLTGVAGVGLAGGWVWWGRRRRQCPVCRKPMLLLAEDADDEHLSRGQRAEEQLGSVDYEVRYCEEHQEVRVLSHVRWFSSYHRCARCGHRTMTRTSRTLQVATYTNGGRVEVNLACSFCDHHSTHVHSTPPLQRSSGTSGGSSGGGSFGGGSFGGGRSGGGSFGGGRSGGGGAGRSW